jgi:CubicO group peptidase (beta-lactamase class C family)
MTTVAAMQCVERGLFSLDEDVCRFLPELKDIQILTAFDPTTKAPVLVKNTTAITMRFVLPKSYKYAPNTF